MLVRNFSLDHVQTKTEIQSLLVGRGLVPRKRFGQHFLIDGNLMRRLVECADISSDDLVIEVGPGTGGLTDLLCGAAERLLCVEIDRDLFAILSSRFADASHVKIACQDALASKHRVAEVITDAIAEFHPVSGGAVKLVANLPYQIATPLVMNLVVSHPAVCRLCFTVQAEVGERLLASPGSKDFGPLAIVAQQTCEIRTIARIGPNAFWPRPQVDSVMIRIDVRADSPVNPHDRAAFAAFVRAVFEHRRKTLRSALGYVVSDDVRGDLADSFDLTRRAEQVGVDQWWELARVALKL